MADTTNLMSIAPIRPATPTKLTSQNTQPKYKSATRAGKKNFDATLDKLNAKLDELKQGVKDSVQIDPDAEGTDTANEIPTQGKSDQPQDATQQAIKDDSEPIAKEEGNPPADIFLGANSTESPVADKNNAESVNEPSAINILAANSMAYLFAMNSESLLTAKPVADSAVVEGVQEISTTQNLQTLLPQSDNKNAQSMLQMLGGKTWRVFNNQPAQSVETPPAQVQTPQPMIQTQAVENQPATVQTPQPVIQTQAVENQPAQVQTPQPMIQTQTVENQPAQVQTAQPVIQTQAVENQPAQVQTAQPVIQTQAVENQPATVQTPQPVIQTQAVENQPATVQTPQPMIQTQAVENQPATVQTPQPMIQTQAVENQPAQVQTPQPMIQTQAVENQPAPVQTPQPVIQTQAVENQPAQVQTPQPVIQTQAADVQPAQVQTPQPMIQTQAAETPPAQVQTPQPMIQTQSVETPPAQVQTPQPMIQTQAAEIQPAQVQTSQPVIQTQAAEIQPAQVQTSQPVIQTQAVENPPAQVQTPQPVIQTQAVEIQPAQVQTPQPMIQTQPAEIQPAQVQTPQPVIQIQAAEIQPAQVQTPQPVIQIQAAEIQPAQVQTPQPVIQTQAVETPPAQVQTPQPTLQNFSELIGADIQVEEAPTAAPITEPQATPQQFQQDNPRQGEQNFQNQIFQPAIGEVQAQPVSTGGEMFAANLAAANDTPQTQQATPTQAPDAPPPAPQDDFNVPAQIVRQARLIRAAENTEMVIKLNPEHLGELTLRVSVSQNGAVNASFHSDNAQVRTIIENSLVQLRHELNNVGLKVENVQVYAGLSDGGGLMNGQGGQAWQQNRQQSSGNRAVNFDTLERDVDATAPVNESPNATGVDYSV